MKNKAVLVRVSLVTRVIVPKDATDEEIIVAAVPRLRHTLIDSPMENIDEIVPDTECPCTADESFAIEYIKNISEKWKK